MAALALVDRLGKEERAVLADRIGLGNHCRGGGPRRCAGALLVIGLAGLLLLGAWARL